MWCDAEECKAETRDIDTDEHSFAGYGWYAKFHPQCCPGAMDGSPCFQHDDGHPDGWAPENPAAYERVMEHEREMTERGRNRGPG